MTSRPCGWSSHGSRPSARSERGSAVTPETLTSNVNMKEHFASIADVYREVRTTDVEPIRYMKRELGDRLRLRAADIGCGAGRYDVLLFDHLPGLHLTCVDTNEAMLREARTLFTNNGITDFETMVSTVEDLSVRQKSYHAIFSFNAVHHFDFDVFLEKSRHALKEEGYLFIYTRLPRHNAETIWGQFFPNFLKKETRLYELGDMYRRIVATEGLHFEAVRYFRYHRKASLDRLITQARKKHYSTLAFYGEEEFEHALAEFEVGLKNFFDDPDAIEWFDQNVLIQARRIADGPG